VSREQHEVVTVLFCDVTGSTELGERLDPEALRALLSRYAEAAAELGTAADLFEQNGDGPLAGEARARSQRLL